MVSKAIETCVVEGEKYALIGLHVKMEGEQWDPYSYIDLCKQAKVIELSLPKRRCRFAPRDTGWVGNNGGNRWLSTERTKKQIEVYVRAHIRDEAWHLCYFNFIDNPHLAKRLGE